MSQLQEASDDLAEITKEIFERLVEFELKYDKLSVDELSIETMNTIGTTKSNLLQVKIHVALS